MTSTCTLHILHTNDLHSHFEQMPHIAALLKEKRSRWEAQGEHVLTVDIGDHLDRMSEPTEATWGKANTQILNRSGYQYATIGNNEGLTLTKAQLNQLYQQADFTVVLSNLREPETGEIPPWAVSYAIHRFGDVQVAILAVTAPFTPAYQQLGWDALAPRAILLEQVSALRPHVDAVVLLSHLGYQLDVELAEQIEGIDVILGAHTHHLLEHGQQVGSTLIAQTGKFGQRVGHITLSIDHQSSKVTAADAEVLDPLDYPEDSGVRAFLAQEFRQAEELLITTVAQLPVDFQLDWEKESPFATFLAASIRDWTKADVGMANSGLLLTELPAGPVTKLELLRCLPHPINPCVVTLTGAQLAKVMERAIQSEFVHKELRGFGFRGKVAGWMGIDGMTVEYGDTPDSTIKQIKIDGHPLEPARAYRVATVDMFMYNRRLLPELLDGKDIRFFLPEVLREVLAATLGNEAIVQSSFTPRYTRC
ncbi:UNVERIFIED_CONTAM: 5'-nucleotidase [Brevibacillus sp. OAP136]